MYKIDWYLMTIKRLCIRLFYKILYFFIFRKYTECRKFCITCKDFDVCMEQIKTVYKDMKKGD